MEVKDIRNINTSTKEVRLLEVLIDIRDILSKIENKLGR